MSVPPGAVPAPPYGGASAPRGAPGPAVLVVAACWEAADAERLAEPRARLSACMGSPTTTSPNTACWTLSVGARTDAGRRRALRAARTLAAPGRGTRVALSWIAHPEASAAAAQTEGQRAAGALLQRVRAANRHGLFVDDSAHRGLGIPGVPFGDYGWRARTPPRRAGLWLSGVVGLGLFAGVAPMWTPRARGTAEAASPAARLWVGVEPAGGRRRPGCVVHPADSVEVHLQAAPGSYSSVLMLSPDGAWSVPHPRLANVQWSPRAPQVSAWFEVEPDVGVDCLYAVSSPQPLDDARALERALNRAATVPWTPANAWLRSRLAATRLRAALAEIAPSAEVFEAPCALIHAP